MESGNAGRRLLPVAATTHSAEGLNVWQRGPALAAGRQKLRRLASYRFAQNSTDSEVHPASLSLTSLWISILFACYASWHSGMFDASFWPDIMGVIQFGWPQSDLMRSSSETGGREGMMLAQLLGRFQALLRSAAGRRCAAKSQDGSRTPRMDRWQRPLRIEPLESRRLLVVIPGTTIILSQSGSDDSVLVAPEDLGSTTTPTGSVEIYQNGVDIGPVALTNGAATVRGVHSTVAQCSAVRGARPAFSTFKVTIRQI